MIAASFTSNKLPRIIPAELDLDPGEKEIIYAPLRTPVSWCRFTILGKFQELVNDIKKMSREDLVCFGGVGQVGIRLIEDLFKRSLEGKPVKIKKYMKPGDQEANIYYCFSDFRDYLRSETAYNSLEGRIKKFLNDLSSIAEPIKFPRLKKALKNCSREKALELIEPTLHRLESLRREGRPHKYFSLVLFNLIDAQTIRDRDKKIWIRDWMNICGTLLWVHFHVHRLPEVSEFIRRWRHLPAQTVLRLMRKWLQNEYKNYGPKDRGFYIVDKKGARWKSGNKVGCRIPLLVNNGIKVVDL